MIQFQFRKDSVSITQLNEEIEFRGLKDQIFVSPCSHIGDHKYGYVTPSDVPALLDQHIAKGEIIERLWRFDAHKLPNGKEEKKSKKHEGSNAQVNKETDTGCCQGANGISCCRDGSSDDVLTGVAVVGAAAAVAVAYYSIYRRSG
ncbi:hypothetical protein ACOSP7_004260 [Xanthoceras sorbifolium]